MPAPGQNYLKPEFPFWAQTRSVCIYRRVRVNILVSIYEFVAHRSAGVLNGIGDRGQGPYCRPRLATGTGG
jgi:hypothetical protein